MDAAEELRRRAEAALSGANAPTRSAIRSTPRPERRPPESAAALAQALRRLAAGELDAGPPRLDPGGELAELAGAFEELRRSMQHQARLEAELTRANRALTESQAWLRVALELGGMGVWRRVIRGQVLEVSPEQARIYGFPPGFTPTQSDFEALYDPEDWAELVGRREQFDLTGAPRETVVSFRRYGDGERRWVLIRREALTWLDGRPAEEVGVVFDITERRERETRLQLMMDELNHRVKNNLATITSLAMQTAKSCEGLPDFLDRFIGRVQALSQSNELLTRTSWGEVELREVIAAALRPFAAEDAVALAGEPPALAVAPRTAVGLSLILHELCTNAAKYGALACDGGRLEVGWLRLGADRAELRWTERLPTPVAPPVRTGFGTTLIRRLSSGDLDGVAELDFRPEGLAAVVRFRL